MRHILIFITSLMLSNAASADTPLTLTDRSENPISAEIVSYMPPDERVILKTEFGTITNSFPSFSAESQQIINHWLADREFSASGLRIDIKKTVPKAPATQALKQLKRRRSRTPLR